MGAVCSLEIIGYDLKQSCVVILHATGAPSTSYAVRKLTIDQLAPISSCSVESRADLLRRTASCRLIKVQTSSAVLTSNLRIEPGASANLIDLHLAELSTLSASAGFVKLLLHRHPHIRRGMRQGREKHSKGRCDVAVAVQHFGKFELGQTHHSGSGSCVKAAHPEHQSQGHSGMKRASGFVRGLHHPQRTDQAMVAMPLVRNRDFAELKRTAVLRRSKACCAPIH